MGQTRLLTQNPNDWHVVLVADGTVTCAEILYDLSVVGKGTARRRPGEPRNLELGTALALQRAFRDAAKTCGLTVKDLMPE